MRETSVYWEIVDAWLKDIRAWLETQPGATEGDGSPLDGVLRVTAYRDKQIANLQQELELRQKQLDARDDEVTRVKSACKELLLSLSIVSPQTGAYYKERMPWLESVSVLREPVSEQRLKDAGEMLGMVGAVAEMSR